MKIIKLNNQNYLNEFVSRQAPGDFLQFWQWGEFQKRLGYKVIRLGVKVDNELVAAATLIKKNLFFNRNYFYSPRGPVIGGKTKEEKFKVFNFLFKEIKKIAKEERVIFWRLEPDFIVQNSQFKIQKTIAVQPFKTLILDLDKSEDELLAAMHQKTRYNIRLAKRKGVIVEEADKNEVVQFWHLLKQTEARDGFRLHPKKYYQNMLTVAEQPIKEKNKLYFKLFLAQYEKKTIAGGIFAFFGKTVTYLHGASANQYRNVMAPHLLQWHLISLAKKSGYRYYDFFGIDETKWSGVTRFKKGFGGRVVEYPGTFDLIFQLTWYRVYQIGRELKRNMF
jgi:lipid II:glycine glycyltransferase (peptidoglycan interpeptide bridge formation enzyme)